MKKLLIIEDDETLANSLIRAMSRRAYSCLLANQSEQALQLAESFQPDFILLDLNLNGVSTQELVSPLLKKAIKAKLVILTGYGTIPSTVQAMRDGASSYLCKPAKPQDIQQALEETVPKNPSNLEVKDPKNLWDIENEHITKVLKACGGNISETARQLGLHRRTLQRRLKKI